MELLRQQLMISDVLKLYNEVCNEEAPDNGPQLKGFITPSENGEYILTFFVDPDGLITIDVRPPFGSYAALEKPYDELNRG